MRKVPWQALIIYSERLIGCVGCCNASPTYGQAVEDAKSWMRKHSMREWKDLYKQPACEIEVAGINIITGINHHGETDKKRTGGSEAEKAPSHPA